MVRSEKIPQPHQLDRVFDTIGNLVFRRFSKLQPVADILTHGHMRKQTIALKHGVHWTLLGPQPGHVLAFDEDSPGSRHDEPANHAQQRGLPASGRAQERKELASVDPDRQGFDRRYSAKALRGFVDFEQRPSGVHERLPHPTFQQPLITALYFLSFGGRLVQQR